MQITYGQFTIDTSALPETTITALLKRGISHVLGNEAAAKVAALVESRRKDGIELTEAEKSAAKAQFQADFVQAMINGELGISTRKPRVDPVEAAALAIAKREVTEKLRGAGLKVPKKDERVAFANGDSFTMDELVARRLEMHGERINKEAAKHVAELEKRAKRLREESAQAQDKSLEALGL